MEEQFYMRVLDQVTDGVYFVTPERIITYWNGGAERITGFDAEEVLGRSCSDGLLRHVNEAGRQLCIHGCPLAGVMRDGHPRSADVFLHHKDGYRVAVRVQGSPLRDVTGAITGSVEVFSQRRPNPYAEASAESSDPSADPVTGIVTRRLGERYLEQLSEGQQGRDGFAVIFADVDRFKSINDAYGHAVGDQALRMVARSLSNALSRSDVPIRWGGDEFVVVLPGADEASAVATAERIRMLVENSWFFVGDDQVRATVSVGLTVAPVSLDGFEAVGRADRQMYAAKAAGGNRVAVHGTCLPVVSDRPSAPNCGAWTMLDIDEWSDAHAGRGEVGNPGALLGAFE
ncbi:MAG: sensor domain-containing diguanylate cyclase [Candidatus Nanopelagicales bacterium]